VSGKVWQSVLEPTATPDRIVFHIGDTIEPALKVVSSANVADEAAPTSNDHLTADGAPEEQ